MLNFLINPFKQFLIFYSEILRQGISSLLMLIIGMIIGWWIYVPIHELLHAAGCLIGGGDVSELQIKAIYGGKILSGIFSFVVSDSDYAGRLTGFDTFGSDWIYTLTVFAPFLLSLPSLYLIELSVRKKRFLLFGSLLPVFFAPVMSLTGDFYELGSLLTYHLFPGADSNFRLLISDDLFRLIDEIKSGANGFSWNYITLSFVFVSSLISICLVWSMMLLTDVIRMVGNKYFKV